MDITVNALLDLSKCEARAIFDGVTYPWEVLEKIEHFIKEYAETLPEDYKQIKENVWVGAGTTIEETALIKGPAIIGRNCEIRHCAYIRENVIVGDGCIIGNSTEIKNAVLFNEVQVPHFNYIGDSVLGCKSHLGAGAIISNFKLDGSEIKVKLESETINAGTNKFGAILGDGVEVGCNSVLNPGTVIGKASIVYPLNYVRGCITEKSIYKTRNEIVERKCNK